MLWLLWFLIVVLILALIAKAVFWAAVGLVGFVPALIVAVILLVVFFANRRDRTY